MKPGLRSAIRAVLYERHKLDLGCPTEEKCHLFQNYGGLKACEGCPKHLKVIPPPFNPKYLRRIKFLSRIEDMINVGCKYGPNDLEPDVWDQLILMARERQKILNQVDVQRKLKDNPHPLTLEGMKAVDKQRKEMGIPKPGESIFSIHRS